ncbi:MAG TPA: hypothetical protein GX706_03610 [Candidatus Moranbacteria bacterium]|nr:hypothetical protein [Candidatus Moranbacteria bacterium]
MKDYSEKNELNIGELVLGNWKEIGLIGLIFAMLFFIVAAFIPPQYKATSSIVISQGSVSAMDAYREAKSSEFVARTSKEVILSNSFMRKTLAQSKVDWVDMSKIEGQDKQLKFWRKKVKVAVIPNTGVMNISIYTKDRELSKTLLTEMINYIVVNKQSFLGEKDVSVSVTNEPYYFSKPTFPNLPLASLVGFILGCLFAIVWTILRSSNLWPAIDSNVQIRKKEKTRKDDSRFKLNLFKASKIAKVTTEKINEAKLATDLITQVKADESKQDSAEKISQLIESEDALYFDKKAESEVKKSVKALPVETDLPTDLPIEKTDSVEAQNISLGSKSFAPIDLPVFEDNKKPSASDIANGYAKEDSDKEVSEEEIKKRLNQLLRGEM